MISFLRDTLLIALFISVSVLFGFGMISGVIMVYVQGFLK